MSEGNSTNPSSRQRRARLLIVGEESATVQPGTGLPEPPTRAANLFDAIGALSAAEAGRPIAAVLIPESELPPFPEPALEALKRVDPSVQLIRVVENGRASDALPIEGFDEAIEAPIAEDTIARILAEATAAPPDRPSAPEPAVAAPPAGDRAGDDIPADELEPKIGATPSPMSAPTLEVCEAREEPSASRAAPGRAIERPAIPAPRRQPPPPPSVPPELAAPMVDIPEELGDTDLIRALMNEPDGARDIALRLIRQQTGWTDVELLDGRSAPAAGKAHVEVMHDGESHGRLVTGMAATKELAPWARWLGHWLALDAAYCDYRMMAYRDDLTGAWNRRYFNRFLEETITKASARRRPLTVMVFDIDDFKIYNDRYGHDAGDIILCETVALLQSVIRESDRVCRIGGDEFAVIFADVEGPREFGSSHPDSVEQIARRFQEQICQMRFPKLGSEALGSLSISAGLATYPWDGLEPSALLSLADSRALESKRKGKNSITYGPAAADRSPSGEA